MQIVRIFALTPDNEQTYYISVTSKWKMNLYYIKNDLAHHYNSQTRLKFCLYLDLYHHVISLVNIKSIAIPNTKDSIPY